LNSANITDEAGNAITGVFDDVPEGTAYPYIVIGDDTATNISAKGLDIHEHTLNIHIWSQYRGRRDIKEIMQRVYTALNDVTLSVSGALGINIKHEFDTTIVEGDGITRHGIMRFRAVVSDS
jgi:hypothetical protein